MLEVIGSVVTPGGTEQFLDSGDEVVEASLRRNRAGVGSVGYAERIPLASQEASQSSSGRRGTRANS
jgi:hypothetical protein